MYKKIFSVFIIMFIISGLAFCQQPVPENTFLLKSYDNPIPSDPIETDPETIADNIILLIGDGMGLTQISSAFYFKNSLPHYARFNSIGLMRTSSTERITDSAAGATAFSAGTKSYNGAIGVDADTTSVSTIVEILSEEQWKTGLIATSSITHATPACFYAHVKSRQMHEEIASQLSTSEVDFFAGGGHDFFAGSTRSDSLDQFAILENNGFTIETEKLDNHADPNKKYGYLLGADALPSVLQGEVIFFQKQRSLHWIIYQKITTTFF